MVRAGAGEKGILYIRHEYETREILQAEIGRVLLAGVAWERAS